MARKKKELGPAPTTECEVCGKTFEQVLQNGKWSNFRICVDCRMKKARQARAGNDTRIIPYVPHAGRDGKSGQVLVHASKKPYKLLACGVRWGKDRCGIAGELIPKFVSMLNEPHRDEMHLVPRVHAWIIAPTIALANQDWREFLHYFPSDWIVNTDKNEKIIETINGGIIEIKSTTNPDNLVSVGLDFVFWTEVAKSKPDDAMKEAWANLYSRIRSPGRGPGGKGGHILLASTPKGLNFYYELYMLAKSDPKNWDVFQFPTMNNPYIPEGADEEARRYLTDKMYRQEWLGEFIESGGEVFSNIHEICVLDGEEEPVSGRRYFAAWDPASPRGDDFSAFTIRDDLGRQVVLRAWTGVQWSEQKAYAYALCKKYHNAPLKILKTGVGETIPADMAAMGLNVEAIHETNELNATWVTHFAVLCEQKEIRLINDDFLKDEALSFEAKVLPSGQIRYAAPKHKHDDRIKATIACYSDFNQPSSTIPFIGTIYGAKRQGY